MSKPVEFVRRLVHRWTGKSERSSDRRPAKAEWDAQQVASATERDLASPDSADARVQRLSFDG
jgi:hypothetical protein